MVIKIRPYNFEDKTKLDLTTFEESKMYEHLINSDMTDSEQQKRFSEAFERIADLDLDLLANCVLSVTIPTGEVTNEAHIKEFIKNADRQTTHMISEKLRKLGNSGIPKELEVECPVETCKHQWKTGMIFDASHFFA